MIIYVAYVDHCASVLIVTGSGDLDYLGHLDYVSHGSHVGLPGSQMPEVLVTAGLEHFLHAIVGIILTLYNNRLFLLFWSLAGNSVCNSICDYMACITP